jgi:predicted ATPase
MTELAAGFHSLPEEYQVVIRLAQERYNIHVTPLQALSGGFSGALIYLASVSFKDTQRVEHFILKLDRKNEKSRTDEINRHTDVVNLSPKDFSSRHIAQMMFERVEEAGVMAIFYAIAGQSLQQYRPLSAFDRQNQLEALFTATYQHLLNGWNANHAIQQALHPQQLLEMWLGFRIRRGGSIENFLVEACGVQPDLPGFLVQGGIMPNPLAYSRDSNLWGNARPLDAATGLQHGDLNTNNILVKFDRAGETIEDFYLIDFALFKENMPLLYDLRYLEASHLVFGSSKASPRKVIDLISRYGEVDRVEPQQVAVETAGICAVINTARQVFEGWISANHPSLRDDLWGQYLLAGVAAGLNYTHKAALDYEERLIGMIFAAANLKRYAALFGVPAPAEGRQLYAALGAPADKPSSSGSPTRVVRRADVDKAPHNLPAGASTFIGREAELSAARALLSSQDVRLVNFTGPGGVGKTRLAMQTASGLLDTFLDGVFLIPLAEVTETELVVPRIAQILGVRASSQPLLETLKDYLREQRLLLVLDNLEQVTDCGPLIVDLLASAPRLKVLATSRILLQVRGEHEYPVPPMETPSKSVEGHAHPLGEYESIQLFVDRARAANPRFALNEANISAVTEICQRLEGLPLAIELAAARIKLFPPQALLARLSNRFAVLTGGARDLPVRQQALRNTLDWSYSLLSAEEQTLFARLSVFVGGFSLDTAEIVCGADGALDVLAGIEALMNNSLLYQEGGLDGIPRFRMLETMREYALERLKERGEQAEIQRSHAYYYIQKVNNEMDLYGPDSTHWLDWLESEHDNVQAVLAWGRSNPEGMVPVTLMISQLVWYWYRRGYFEVGRSWTEEWVERTADAQRSPIRALALLSNALMIGWQGDAKLGLEKNEAGLEMSMQLEDERLVSMGLLSHGVMHINLGNDATAHPIFKEAQEMFREADNPFFKAVTLVHLANVSLGLGNPQEALDWLDKAQSLSDEVREDWLTAFVLNNLGEVARVQGDYTNARRYYEESEAMLRALGDKGDLARLVNSLGYMAQHAGDLETAKEKFRESLALFRRLGNKRGIAEALAGTADLRQAEGHPEQAALLLSYAESLMTASHSAWWPADRVEIERSRAVIEEKLGPSRFAEAWARGEAMGFDQAMELALDENR